MLLVEQNEFQDLNPLRLDHYILLTKKTLSSINKNNWKVRLQCFHLQDMPDFKSLGLVIGIAYTKSLPCIGGLQADLVYQLAEDMKMQPSSCRYQAQVVALDWHLSGEIVDPTVAGRKHSCSVLLENKFFTCSCHWLS